MVRRLQPPVDKDVLMKVHSGFFHSIIKYGIVFWGNSPLAQGILLLQKRICKHKKICEEPYLTPCKGLFVDSEVLTMSQFVESALLVLELALMVKRKPDIFTRQDKSTGLRLSCQLVY